MKLNRFKSILRGFINEDLLSIDVYDSATKVILYITPAYFLKLDVEEVYYTGYGTVVINFNIFNNGIVEFELEIGKSDIGYFFDTETDGRPHMCDSLSLSDDEFKNTIKQLNEDLKLFFEEHEK